MFPRPHRLDALVERADLGLGRPLVVIDREQVAHVELGRRPERRHRHGQLEQLVQEQVDQRPAGLGESGGGLGVAQLEAAPQPRAVGGDDLARAIGCVATYRDGAVLLEPFLDLVGVGMV